VRRIFPDGDRLKRADVGFNHRGTEVDAKNKPRASAEVPASGFGDSARLPEIVSRVRGMPGTTLPQGDRRIGCRQTLTDSNHSGSRLKRTDSLGSLPVCRAATILRAHFRGSSRLTLVEDWVDSVIGEGDSRHCFGPTAVTRAGKRLHVYRIPDPDLQCDGELWHAGGLLIAFTSDSQSPQREMFTMAHELGHASLYAINPEVDQNNVEVERICDIFASELIMPINFVREMWRRIPDVEAVTKIMNKCGTSLPASCRRVADYLGDATVGIASDKGIIQERYGIGMGRELRSALDWGLDRTLEQKLSTDLPDGLALSLMRVRKERIIFLVRRIM
jgi:Zn-dependent peptidase ImmA (M78 family)